MGGPQGAEIEKALFIWTVSSVYSTLRNESNLLDFEMYLVSMPEI